MQTIKTVRDLILALSEVDPDKEVAFTDGVWLQEVKVRVWYRFLIWMGKVIPEKEEE